MVIALTDRRALGHGSYGVSHARSRASHAAYYTYMEHPRDPAARAASAAARPRSISVAGSRKSDDALSGGGVRGLHYDSAPASPSRSLPGPATPRARAPC